MVKVRTGILGCAHTMTQVQTCEMTKGVICRAHDSAYVLEGVRISFVLKDNFANNV